MRTLQTVKLPLMILVSVGGVWAVARENSAGAGYHDYLAPPPSVVKLSAEIRQQAVAAGEAVADLGDEIR